jgi:hypothetical protein
MRHIKYEMSAEPEYEVLLVDCHTVMYVNRFHPSANRIKTHRMRWGENVASTGGKIMRAKLR